MVRGADLQGLAASRSDVSVVASRLNSATAFHTDADLDVSGLHVPKGTYTLYVLVQDPGHGG
jgi:hypothetical protein